MINIGFLFVHPPNESMGSMSFLRDQCKILSKEGHNCYIFTPYDFQYENWGKNIHFHKIKGFSSKSKWIYKLARRFFNNKYLARYLMLNSRIINSTIQKLSYGLLDCIDKNNIQLDLLQGEQEFGALAICRIKQKISIPNISNLHNFWPEELIANGIIKKKSKIYTKLIKLEEEIQKNSDHIFVPSEFFKKYLIQQFKFPIDKISVLFHGGFIELEKPIERINPPIAIFSGLVVHRSNFKLFLDSVEYIMKKIPQAEFYITRKGENVKNVEKVIKKKGLPIKFYWFDQFKDYLSFVSKSSVGIITSSNDLPRKFGPASKMLDFLSVGVPVVGNDIGSWSSIIHEENIGFLSSNDSKDLGNKIIKLLENQELSKELGMNGINLIKDKLNWDIIVKRDILPIYENLDKTN